MVDKHKVFSNIAQVMTAIFMSLGVITLTIIFHEVYHLHITGEVTGVCVGKCYTISEVVPAAIHWSVTEEELNNLNPNEEINAWIFAIIITSLTMLLYAKVNKSRKIIQYEQYGKIYKQLMV